MPLIIILNLCFIFIHHINRRIFQRRGQAGRATPTTATARTSYGAASTCPTIYTTCAMQPRAVVSTPLAPVLARFWPATDPPVTLHLLPTTLLSLAVTTSLFSPLFGRCCPAGTGGEYCLTCPAAGMNDGATYYPISAHLQPAMPCYSAAWNTALVRCFWFLATGTPSDASPGGDKPCVNHACGRTAGSWTRKEDVVALPGRRATIPTIKHLSVAS